MGRKIWQGGLAGLIAAIVAWCVSLPFLPYKVLDRSITSGLENNSDPASDFTLGTFYGWFSNALFGMLAGLLISFVYTLKMGPVARLRAMLISATVGGALVCGADALGDTVGIKIAREAGRAAPLLHMTVIPLLWALLLSCALCGAVLLGMSLRIEMLWRFLVAVALSTVVAVILKAVADSVVGVLAFALVMKSKGPTNSWSLAAPGFLASDIAIGVTVGICLAFAERLTRPAWLHLALAYGEGYTWSIGPDPMRIGSAEGVEIRVQEMQGLAPIHAQIQRYDEDFAVQDLGGGVRVNGNAVASSWIIDNDRIALGPYEFIFHLRRPVHRRDRDYAPTFVEEPKKPSDHPDEPTGPRFEDDFDNTYPLVQKTSIVGRDATCEIPIGWDVTVSRRHAEVILGPNGAMIRDLASSNGTRLNGTVIQSVKIPLKEGDVVEFGKARLTFRE